VTAGPGGETAVACEGHLRASHADREQVIDTLKAAFVQGRLTKDDFDARIGQAFASRIYAELAAVTADLPARLAAVQPLRTPVRALSRAEMAAAWAIYGIVLTVILTIAVVPGPTTIGVIAITAAVIYAAFWLLGGILMVVSRRGRGLNLYPGQLPPVGMLVRPLRDRAEAHQLPAAGEPYPGLPDPHVGHGPMISAPQREQGSLRPRGRAPRRRPARGPGGPAGRRRTRR